MAFRQKSPERLIAWLQRLLLRYPTRLVGMPAYPRGRLKGLAALRGPEYPTSLQG
jgi:hypothetical protein